MGDITNWTGAVTSAFSSALSMFMGAVPKVLGFLIILIIGWIIAGIIASAIASLLRRVKFNDLASKAGITGFINNAGIKNDASGLLGFVVKWFIRIIALIAAFDALGLPAVQDIFTRLLNWMPNLLVAMVILVVGGWAANAVTALVRGAAKSAEADNSNMLASLARTSVWVLTGIVAVNQLGIASELVQILFTAIVGALAIGLGLAVGLGGKDLAGDILRKWYDKTR